MTAKWLPNENSVLMFSNIKSNERICQFIDLCFSRIDKKNLGALLPSHGLPPFGANITNIAMSEGLCGSSMFGSDRWSVGVTPMTAGK